MTNAECNFIGYFNEIAAGVHKNAVSKGFWESPRSDSELIVLMHSELSEALEAARHADPPDDKIPEFSGVEAELADVIIRIMDAAAQREWRVAEALVQKVAFNQGRQRKHGKEF